MPALTDNVRIAVVGYGYWGSKHVRVLSSIPGVAVTVVDGRPDRLADAAAHHPVARLAQRLDEVLPHVDGVLVATPPASHARLAQYAVEHDRHVFVEKPLTTSVEDAERLVASAEEHGQTLMVGHTFEYNPAVWKLRDLIRDGTLGPVLYVDTARLSLGRYQSDVNVVWDLACHDISIVSYVLDEMPTATGVWAQRSIGGLQADVAYLRLDFPRVRAQGFVHVSWLSPNKVRRVTVVGEKMMAVYDDMSDNERIRVYDIGVDVQTMDEPTAAHALPVSYRTGNIVSPYVPFQEPLLLQDEHFIDCIRTGCPPRTSGRRGLDVVRVLAATDQAVMEAGRPFALAAARAGPAGLIEPGTTPPDAHPEFTRDPLLSP